MGKAKNEPKWWSSTCPIMYCEGKIYPWTEFRQVLEYCTDQLVAVNTAQSFLKLQVTGENTEVMRQHCEWQEIFYFFLALIFHSVYPPKWVNNRTLPMAFACSINGLEPMFCSFTKDLYCFFSTTFHHLSSLIKSEIDFKK